MIKKIVKMLNIATMKDIEARVLLACLTTQLLLFSVEIKLCLANSLSRDIKIK